VFLNAQVVTSDLEYQKITGVGYSWQTVNLSNSYSDAIIVCTNVLPDSEDNESVVRIDDISSNSFKVKIQQPQNSDPGYTTDAYCIISDEGNYTIPFKYEAHKVVSDNTNGATWPNDWSSSRAEEVTSDIVQSYTRPVVLGQVMSYNDSNFSVFWSFNCNNRKRRPYESVNKICVGKHVGQIREMMGHSSETLGYIVAEAGIYELKDFSMAVNYGNDSVKGVGDAPPYTYTLDKSYTDGVITKEAEDGGQGGWAVLYGSTPFGTSLDMAIDEETVAGDDTRRHTTEQVAYWVFLYDPITSAEMIINEVLYRQTTGSGSGNDEFIEFYVTQAGDLKNYLFSDQDGTSHQYRFASHSVNTGDYVILHIGSGTDSVSGSVHHFYKGGSVLLNNDGDDILLCKPVNLDVTEVDGKSLSVVPVDYISYDTAGPIDPIPESQLGVTVSWALDEVSRLASAPKGQSIALTPNAQDGNTSLCWELSATTTSSKKATNCTNYISTRDTNTDSGQTNSITLSNTVMPNMSITKTSIVTSDPVNSSTHPKRIPGATIRYCFTVDNTGDGDADEVTVADSLSGGNKENLTYIQSGSIVQDISTLCDCSAISTVNGTISGSDVTIVIGDINGTNDTSHSRGCAYIQTTVN